MGVPLVGGEAVPQRDLGVVLRDPGAIPVHHPEVALPGSVPLVGGEAAPGVVLRDPGALHVHVPEVALPTGIPLAGGEAEPPDCLAVVLRDPGAILVHHPELAAPTGGRPRSARPDEGTRPVPQPTRQLDRSKLGSCRPAS